MLDSDIYDVTQNVGKTSERLDRLEVRLNENTVKITKFGDSLNELNTGIDNKLNELNTELDTKITKFGDSLNENAAKLNENAKLIVDNNAEISMLNLEISQLYEKFVKNEEIIDNYKIVLAKEFWIFNQMYWSIRCLQDSLIGKGLIDTTNAKFNDSVINRDDVGNRLQVLRNNPWLYDNTDDNVLEKYLPKDFILG